MYRSAPLQCPTCRLATLSEVVAGNVARHDCSKCGGVFVPTESLTLLGDASELPHLLRTGFPQMATESTAPRRCPRGCEGPLNGFAVVGRSGEEVTVDVCPRHGLWFDARELDAAIELLRDPLPVPELRPSSFWKNFFDRLFETDRERLERRNRGL